jgi:hypothetical protein
MPSIEASENEHRALYCSNLGVLKADRFCSVTNSNIFYPICKLLKMNEVGDWHFIRFLTGDDKRSLVK